MLCAPVITQTALGPATSAAGEPSRGMVAILSRRTGSIFMMVSSWVFPTQTCPFSCDIRGPPPDVNGADELVGVRIDDRDGVWLNLQRRIGSRVEYRSNGGGGGDHERRRADHEEPAVTSSGRRRRDEGDRLVRLHARRLERRVVREDRPLQIPKLVRRLNS
jgi:hypothetical protein